MCVCAGQPLEEPQRFRGPEALCSVRRLPHLGARHACVWGRFIVCVSDLIGLGSTGGVWLTVQPPLSVMRASAHPVRPAGALSSAFPAQGGPGSFPCRGGSYLVSLLSERHNLLAVGAEGSGHSISCPLAYGGSTL